MDGIETGADVTDTANVTAAGALMDSEVTDLAGIKGVTISTLQVKPTEGAFVDGDKTKLDGIETGADVTDTANVAAAGAVMNTGDETIAGAKEFSTIITGNITGNAGTATQLASAVNIGGASFNGSANISIQLETQTGGPAPASPPNAGTMIFDTSNNKIYIYNSTNGDGTGGAAWRYIDTKAV